MTATFIDTTASVRESSNTSTKREWKIPRPHMPTNVRWKARNKAHNTKVDIENWLNKHHTIKMMLQTFIECLAYTIMFAIMYIVAFLIIFAVICIFI